MSTGALDEHDRLTPSIVLAALVTQGRVIRALILRETKTRYGEHKIGFLWALLEPLLMVVVFVLLFSSTRADTIGNMPLVPFMITGIVPFSLFRDPLGQMQGSIASNRTLLGFPQVTTFDIIISRGLLEMAIILAVYALILCLAQLVGYEIRIEDPLGVLASCLALAMIGMGLGFFFASVSPIVPSLRQVGTLVLGRPMFIASGLFFVAADLPAGAREWMMLNPLLHMMELQRSHFFYEFESTDASWEYAGTWAICTFTFGLLTHQALRKRAVIGL